MSNAVSQPNWQSVGRTLSQEIKYVEHLRPNDNVRSAGNQTNSMNSHLRHSSILSRRNTFNQHNIHSRHNTLRASGLVHTLSNPVTLKRSSSISTSAKLVRFFRRFSWNKRSKAYFFGKSYLQRDPSFVVTPDQSSYNYNYKCRDLCKPKPRPRAWRTSRPISFWKNNNPMELLKPGASVPLSATTGKDEQLTTNVSEGPIPGETFFTAREGPTAPDGITGNELSTSKQPFEPRQENDSSSLTMDSRYQPFSANNNTVNHDRPSLVKISLPVKHNRTLSTSKDGMNTSSSGSTQNKRDKWINNLPQTPMSGIISSLPSGTTASSTEHPRIPSRNLFSDTPIPQAKTSETQLRSPTSLPSSFRPESWRRSAVIARNSVIEDPEIYDSEDFVGVWSQYLRKAIAQRAVHSRERKSVEIENEMRWSRNLQWDSDTESNCSISAIDSNPSKISLNTTNTTTTSSNSANSYKYSSSKLAPLHSPRAMASASRLQSNLSNDQRGNNTEQLHTAIPTTIESPRARQVSLYTNPEGESLKTPWQPEHGSGSSHSHSTTSNSDISYGKFSQSLESENVLLPDHQHENALTSETEIENARLSEPPMPRPFHPVELDPLSPRIEAEQDNEDWKEIDLDLTDHSSSRKRHWPASPVSTPPQNPVGNRSVENILPLKLESSSNVALNQSMRRQNMRSQKRIKNSDSKEHLLHSRQRTLESLWGAEESDASVDAN